MSASPVSHHRRRGLRAPWVSAASLTAMVLGVVFLGVAPASAAAPAACWDDVPADVDGGGPDVAIGMPSYDLPGKPDAGAIVVFSNVAAAGNANPKAPTARTLYTADNFSGLSSKPARASAPRSRSGGPRSTTSMTALICSSARPVRPSAASRGPVRSFSFAVRRAG